MPKKLEEKRDSYLKKLKRLGKELNAIGEYHKQQVAKVKAKTASYEAKLKKIDAKLKDI